MTPGGDAATMAAEVAAAHGAARWAAAEAVEVRLSSGGLAFAAKGQSHALRDLTARVATRSQSVELTGTRPEPWRFRAEDGAQLVAACTRLSRRLRWSQEDVAAFAAAALWTYVALPFVLVDPAYELERLPDRHGLRRLGVRFPPGVATHSPSQVLHVDGDGLIRRHDYTALAFGRWATAAHVLTEYRELDGLLAATRRRVTPRLGGRPLPGPTLVWIEVADVCVAG
jgi:hypothetical protein